MISVLSFGKAPNVARSQHSDARSHRSLHLQRPSLVAYDLDSVGTRICLFRSTFILSRHVRLFTAKTFGHLSDRAKKTLIDRVLTLEHYITSITSKVLVSRYGIEPYSSRTYFKM